MFLVPQKLCAATCRNASLCTAWQPNRLPGALTRFHLTPLTSGFMRHAWTNAKTSFFKPQSQKTLSLLSSVWTPETTFCLSSSSARFGNIWGRHGWNQVSEVILLFCDCLKKSCKSESISCKTSPNLQGHHSHCTLCCQNCKRFSANADIFVLRKQQN